jgi:gluconate 2-dehydrogenase gamma chain
MAVERVICVVRAACKSLRAHVIGVLIFVCNACCDVVGPEAPAHTEDSGQITLFFGRRLRFLQRTIDPHVSSVVNSAARMDEDPEFSRQLSRREFVADVVALSAVWLLAGAACSRESSWGGDATKLVHLSPGDAAQCDAISARILPSDDTPGAREAGVVYFIDQSLNGFSKEQAPLFAEGLRTLGETVVRAHGSGSTFAGLTTQQQDSLLREIETTPFFIAVRFATLAGFLSLPKYGGHPGYIGWKLIGQETGMEQKPPFGWYDRPENQLALLGEVL